MKTLKAIEIETKADPRLAAVFYYRSSNGVTVYQTLLFKDGQISCDCPGWTKRCSNGVRSCKHTRFVASGMGAATAEVYSEYVDGAASVSAQRMEWAKAVNNHFAKQPAAPVSARGITLEDE